MTSLTRTKMLRTVVASMLVAFCSFIPTASQAAVGVPSAVKTKSSVNGWRQFKFGLTADQARALPPPGQPWMYTPPKNIKIRNMDLSKFSALFSKGPFKELGFDFDSISLAFTAGEGLNNILMAAEKNESTGDCEKSFQMLLMALDARYGNFVPGYRNVSGTEVRNTPGANSHYQYALGTSHSGVGFWADARRVIGEKSLSVETTRMTDGACMKSVMFSDHNPVNPNAPSYRRSDRSYGRPDE